MVGAIHTFFTIDISDAEYSDCLVKKYCEIEKRKWKTQTF